MRSVDFPTRDVLKSWLEAVEDTALNAYLPGIDEAWYGQMESALQTTSIRPDCRADLCRAGALVFYKIIKNHYRVDGNKRSAVLTTYLFFVFNRTRLTIDPESLYELSRSIAENEGPMETAVEEILSKFSSACEAF